MAPKVKVFLVFLAVIAILSVFSFFDIFNGVKSALLSETSKPLPLGLEEDIDQDGLSNQDEQYWNTDFQNPDSDGDGFLDGEEVASGFDPRESSSHELGDSLEDTVFGSVKAVEAGDFTNVNLTDDASQLLLAGMAAGDLTRTSDDTTYEKGVNAIAFSTIDTFYKSLPVINPTLNIVDDSQDNQTKYLESLAQIIKEDLIDLSKKINFEQNPFTQNDFFLTKGSRFASSMNSASSLNIPKNWIDTHKKIIDLLNHFSLSYTAIGRYDTDAVKAVIAFNDVERLNNLTKDLLEEVQSKIKSNNLNPNDVVFKIMSAIY